MTRVWGPDPERNELAELYRRVRDEQLRDDVPEQGPRDPATTMLPAVGRHELRPIAAPVPAPLQFTHDDGTTYQRVDPDEFPSYDDVDSTTVDLPGAPD